MSEVKIIESAPIKRSDYKAILGFAGAGFIGNTAAMFTVRNRGFSQVAYVRSDYLPPMTLIIEGKPVHSFRVHADDAGGLLFVITESLIPGDGCWPIALELFRWLRDKNVKEIYALEGLPFSTTSQEIKVLGFCSGIDLGTYGIPALREGALSGLNSCLLEECVEKGMPYANLFIPTNKLTSIDYGGSADGVDVLNKIFKLGVDSSPLRMNNEAQRRMAEQKQSTLGKVFKRG